MPQQSSRHAAGSALALLILFAPYLRGPGSASICTAVGALALMLAVLGTESRSWSSRAAEFPWPAVIAVGSFALSCLIGLLPLGAFAWLAGPQGSWRTLGWEATQLGAGSAATLAADSAALYESLAQTSGVLAVAAAAWLVGVRWSQRLALTWIVSATLQALLACGASLVAPSGGTGTSTWIHGAAGSFGNPNQLAEWLLVGWVLALGLLDSRRASVPRGWLLAALPLLGIGLLLTRSRAGWLLAAGSLLGIVILNADSRLTLKRMAWATAPLLIALTLASGSVGAGWIQTLQQDAPFGSRLAVIAQTARMAIDHPMVGVGIGGYSTLFEMYRPAGVQHYWDHAHSDALQLVAESGLPIGLIILGIAAWLLGARWRRHSTARRLERSFTYALSIIACYTLFEFGLRAPPLMFGAAILLGAAIQRQESKPSC